MENMNVNEVEKKETEGISLSDLAEGAIPTATAPDNNIPTKLPKLDTKTAKEVDVREVALPKKSEKIQTEMGNPMIDAAFNGLDEAIERTRSESMEIVKKAEDERIEKLIDEDEDSETNNSDQRIKLVSQSEYAAPVAKDDVSFDDEDDSNDIPEAITSKEDTNEVTSTVNENNEMASTTKVAYKPESINTDISDDDLKLLDDEDDDDLDKDEDQQAVIDDIKEKIRIEVKENFKPVSEKLDFSNFKIAKKPVSASKVINHIQKKPIEAADGVLYNANRAVRMSAFTAIEIQSLDQSNIKRSNYNQFMIEKLRLIYNHLIDANKPASFEAWMKSMTNDVIDDYFFTAYKATFGRSNIITYTCGDDSCHNVYMDKKNVEDMVKFKNDDVKKKYMEILHSGNVNTVSTQYETSLYQASDEYAFSLRKPSLYATYIEPSLINEEFMRKYEDLLLLISYIDDIYIIDKENNQLLKIDTKPDPRRPEITVKRKIKTYATIIKSLTSDQLQALSIETDKFDAGELDDEGNLITDIKYVYPEDTCPKCGKTIAEVEESPDRMLFMRHQLGLMSKM